MASPRLDSLTLRGLVEPAQTLLKGHLMLQDNYRLYTDIERTCKHMDWLDLYIATSLEQYDYTPMADLCTLFYAWVSLSRVWTVTVDTLKMIS